MLASHKTSTKKGLCCWQVPVTPSWHGVVFLFFPGTSFRSVTPPIFTFEFHYLISLCYTHFHKHSSFKHATKQAGPVSSFYFKTSCRMIWPPEQRPSTGNFQRQSLVRSLTLQDKFKALITLSFTLKEGDRNAPTHLHYGLGSQTSPLRSANKMSPLRQQ